MSCSTSVKRRFVWVYASIQFALVVLFAHVFYNLVRTSFFVSEHFSSLTRTKKQFLKAEFVPNFPGSCPSSSFNPTVHICWIRSGDERQLHHSRGDAVEETTGRFEASERDEQPDDAELSSSALLQQPSTARRSRSRDF